MEHLLFAGYLIVFAWLVTQVKFFTRSGLTAPQLIIIFLLKVMAGIFYGWVGVYYGEMAQMVDTWAYHYQSGEEYQLLVTDPQEFFSRLFRNTHASGYGKFLSSDNSWWNDLHGNFFIKLLAVFNLVSFGHYFVNVILYSFITLFGPMAVYRVMQEEFPTKKTAVLFATFFIPSFLYWTGGIHKDGLIFVGIGLIIYPYYFGLKTGFTWWRIVLILFGLVLILVIRNYLLIVIVPALLAWFAAAKIRWHSLLLFSVVYLFFIVLFFTARYVHPALDFPQAVSEKQQSFFQLKGGSAVAVNRLEPTPLSFMRNAPEALSLTALRPYPTDVKHLLSLAAAVGIMLLLLVVVIFLIYRKHRLRLSPFVLFCLFFSFSVLLIIGYTVHFLGAIVRYRSIVLPFLMVPVAAQIDWKWLFGYLSPEIATKNHI